MRFHMVEEAKFFPILAPAADAAGRTGTGFSLKHYNKAFLCAFINQGNAATVLLTPQQCTAVAGTGAKAIPAVPIWAALDYATSDALVRAADAVNYTTDAGVKVKCVVFEIPKASLDVEGGFDCLRLNTGASNVANITSAFALLVDAKYAGATPPSVMVD